MKCLEARQLFLGRLDGELTPAGVQVLDAHLAGCAECAAQFQLEQEMSIALREFAVPRGAPLGFARRVTEAIEIQRRPRWADRARKLATGGRLGLVAALALILIGSAALGNHALQWFERGSLSTTIVENTPGQSDEPLPNSNNPGPDKSETPAGPETDPGPDNTEPGVNEPKSDPDAEDVENQDPDTTAPDTTSKVEPDEGVKPPQTQPDKRSGPALAAAPEVEQKVFLNKQRVIRSILLNVSVKDLVAARAKAILLAGEVGASGKLEVVPNSMEFYVEPARAEEFVERLSTLGQVTNRENNRQDYTEWFSKTYENYRALVAELRQESDPDKQAALERQKAELERDLTEKDRQAGVYTIVLVLQEVR